jgi:hypothetical protein
MIGRKVKLGIAGCGGGTIMYGPALRFIEQGQVVAWMDPVFEKAKAASDRY